MVNNVNTFCATISQGIEFLNSLFRQGLGLTLMQKLPDKYVFAIGEKLKHTRPGKHQEPIELTRFTDRDLCVVEHITEYIRRTDNLRQEHAQLLISFVKPYKPVSKDTITRWVKGTLLKAGIDVSTFTAHSSRAAATSYGANTEAKLDDMLKAAGWSSAQTFSKHYNKPIEYSNLGSHILGAYELNTLSSASD